MFRSKHILFIFLALVSSCHVYALKIMTFNLLKGGKHKKTALLKVLEKGDADIVVINEANDATVFHDLSKTLGYHSILSIKNNYNVGVLSRFPIKSHKFYQMKVLAKSLVEVHINVPDVNEDIIVFACHLNALSTNKRRKKRLKEMKAILPIISKYQGRKVILAGDMNEVSHLDKRIKGSCISKLIQKAGFVDSYRNYHDVVEVSPGYTHNILMVPTKRIDYIYLSNHFKIVSSNTLDKKNMRPWPSDHAAVLTKVEFKKSNRNDSVLHFPIPKKKNIIESIPKE